MVLISFASVLAFAVGAILLLVGAHAKGAEKKKIECDPQKAKQFLGQKDLTAMLVKLAQSPAPTDLDMGAKCYKMRFDKETVDFVCSACKHKTAYPAHELKELRDVQRIIQAISPKLDVNLDDRRYCKHCNPDRKIKTLYLTVTLHDSCEAITSPIGLQQLQMIQALLDGKDRIASKFGLESALRDFEQQLRAILLGEE